MRFVKFHTYYTDPFYVATVLSDNNEKAEANTVVIELIKVRSWNGQRDDGLGSQTQLKLC